MFTKRTVFIVGAGGSYEVGLPVGDVLKEQIAKKLDIRFNNSSQVSGDYNITSAIRLHLERTAAPRDINPYRNAAVSISKAMPLAPSIDNFLHLHGENEKITLMGKLGIAACIMEAEQNSKINIARHSNQAMNFANGLTTWHARFVQMMLQGIPKSEIHNCFGNVSIITFNYDRCIEHYISHALANQLQCTLVEAQRLTNNLEIIHPYGQIGQLPWRNDRGAGYEYGTEPTSDNLLEISKQIKTFTEQVDDQTLLSRIGHLLALAENIVFIGFAFWPINMKLLNAPNTGVQKTIVSTTLGLSKPKVETIDRTLRTSFETINGNKCTLHFEDAPAYKTLSDYAPLIAE